MTKKRKIYIWILLHKLYMEEQPIIRELEIWLNTDIGIRGLISKLWEHDYVTKSSCNGHNGKPGYVVVKKGTGDGWFEENSQKYGLTRMANQDSCNESHHPGYESEYKNWFACPTFDGGINGHVIYRG